MNLYQGFSESNAEVGDRANDVLRINGNEVKAKIIGEGGGPGCTQLAGLNMLLMVDDLILTLQIMWVEWIARQ